MHVVCCVCVVGDIRCARCALRAVRGLCVVYLCLFCVVRVVVVSVLKACVVRCAVNVTHIVDCVCDVLRLLCLVCFGVSCM